MQSISFVIFFSHKKCNTSGLYLLNNMTQMPQVNKNGNINRPRIKPPQIANCDKFPEIFSEACDLFRVIRGIFPSMNSLLYILVFLITIN